MGAEQPEEVTVWPWSGSDEGMAEANRRAIALAVLVKEHGLQDEAAAAIRDLQRRAGTHILLADEVEAVIQALVARKHGGRR